MFGNSYCDRCGEPLNCPTCRGTGKMRNIMRRPLAVGESAGSRKRSIQPNETAIPRFIPCPTCHGMGVKSHVCSS